MVGACGVHCRTEAIRVEEACDVKSEVEVGETLVEVENQFSQTSDCVVA